MSDLTEGLDFDEPLYVASTHIVNHQSESVYNGPINGTFNSFDSASGLSDETMRILFLAIASITILICLTICITVCICMCLNRRRSSKRQEKQNHLLLPEQSEQVSTKKTPITNSFLKHTNSTISSNGKQQSDKKNMHSSIPQSSSNIILGKIPISPYYYDNLDDIPFIDESRPTSYMDITGV